MKKYIFFLLILSDRVLGSFYPFEEYFEQNFFEKVYTNYEIKQQGLQSKIVKKEFLHYLNANGYDSLYQQYGYQYEYYLGGKLSKEIRYRVIDNKIVPNYLRFFYYDHLDRLDSVMQIDFMKPEPESRLLFKYYYYPHNTTRYYYGSEKKLINIDSCYYDEKGKLILEFLVDIADWRISTEKYILKYDKNELLSEINTYEKSTYHMEPELYYDMYILTFFYDSDGHLNKRRINRKWWNEYRYYFFDENNYLRKTVDTALNTDPFGYTYLRTDNMAYEFKHDLFNKVIEIKRTKIEDYCRTYIITDIEKVEYEYYTSVSDNNENNYYNLTLYPNPARYYIEISYPPSREWAGDVSVRIFDMLGTEYSTLTPTLFLKNEGIRIDVSSINPGVYFVRVGNEVRKFVKI